ncbi:MAG: hypothetical protein KatS3mg014_0388 [Actinomycetota bacterium]|nr:MAG: hypothetical protein KatS3mg014_0388 [Actinomycetota bacterium]
MVRTDPIAWLDPDLRAKLEEPAEAPDLAAILEEVRGQLLRFVIFPCSEAADAVALYAGRRTRSRFGSTRHASSSRAP